MWDLPRPGTEPVHCKADFLTTGPPGKPLESLLWGIPSRFPLTSHFDLSGSESAFGISQNPLMCACSSLCQGELWWRGLWEVDITYCEVMSPPFSTSKEPFCACVVREVSLTLRSRNMWSFIWVGPNLLHHSTFMQFLSIAEKLFSLGHVCFLPHTYTFCLKIICGWPMSLVTLWIW